MPDMLIIAEPNGSGKSTTLSPNCKRSNMKSCVSPFILFLLVVFCSCNGDTHPPEQILLEHKRGSDSANEHNEEDFYNSINQPSVNLPYVGHFRSKDSNDTLDYEIFPDSSYSSVFTGYLYIRGDKARLKFDETTSIAVYSEGDIDGNGTEEIGLMLGWHTSGCRGYSLKTYSRNKWREIAYVGTHLPDREKGVDYFKNVGKQIRIISANSGACCQCLQLDTTFRNIPPGVKFQFK